MSAEVLRKAAALMRERAEATTARAQWTDGHYWIEDYDPSDPTGNTGMQVEIGGMGQSGDAAHYSSWHPAVALAVADWLDATAERHAPVDNPWNLGQPCCQTCGLDLEGDEAGYCDDFAAALAVATAYLGDPA